MTLFEIACAEARKHAAETLDLPEDDYHDAQLADETRAEESQRVKYERDHPEKPR